MASIWDKDNNRYQNNLIGNSIDSILNALWLQEALNCNYDFEFEPKSNMISCREDDLRMYFDLTTFQKIKEESVLSKNSPSIIFWLGDPVDGKGLFIENLKIQSESDSEYTTYLYMYDTKTGGVTRLTYQAGYSKQIIPLYWYNE